MKIILKGMTIEMTYEEFQKLFPLKNTKNTKPVKITHNVTDRQKEIIKKIFIAYPKRSLGSVGRELGLHKNTIRYWKEKLMKTSKTSF